MTFTTGAGSDAFARAIEDVRELARGAQREDLAEQLGRGLERAATPRSQVLFVGEFKQGKSQLINALLCDRIAPADPVFASSAPLSVAFGAGVVFEAVTTDRTVEHRAVVEPEEVLDLLTDRSEVRHDPYMLSATCPADLLTDGLVLVDTPPVGGGLAGAHAAATVRALGQASAVVLVSDASQELVEAELAFLETARSICPVVIAVLTKIDLYPEWRLIHGLNMGHLQAAGFAIDMIPVSALLAQQARARGDRELTRRSGIDELRTSLTTGLMGSIRLQAQRDVSDGARAVLNRLERTTQTELAALMGDEHRSRLEDQLLDAESAARSLHESAAGWKSTLNDGLEDLARAAQRKLLHQMDHIRESAYERIDQCDPADEWPEIESWLYEHTNLIVIDTGRDLSADAAALAQRVAAHFAEEAAAAEIHLPTDVDVPDSTIEADISMERLQAFDLGFSAAQGAVSGVIITSILGGIVGAPLLPIGIVLGAVVGGRRLISARKAKLQSRRMQAKDAVAKFMGAQRIQAREELEDALTAIRRRLRSFFSERAVELERSARIERARLQEQAEMDRASLVAKRQEARDHLGSIEQCGLRLESVAP